MAAARPTPDAPKRVLRGGLPPASCVLRPSLGGLPTAWQAVRRAEAMRQVAVRHIGELDVLLLVAETQLKMETQAAS